MSRIAGGGVPNQVLQNQRAAEGSAAPDTGQRVAGGVLPMSPSAYLAELRRLNPGASEEALRGQVRDWIKQMLPVNQG